jgi:hypothetical protein
MASKARPRSTPRAFFEEGRSPVRIDMSISVMAWWCPRPDSNRHGREAEGFSCRFGFRRRLAPFVAWSTPSP